VNSSTTPWLLPLVVETVLVAVPLVLAELLPTTSLFPLGVPSTLGIKPTANALSAMSPVETNMPPTRTLVEAMMSASGKSMTTTGAPALVVRLLVMPTRTFNAPLTSTSGEATLGSSGLLAVLVVLAVHLKRYCSYFGEWV